MSISSSVMNNILRLLESEVTPAEGCTEPVAISFAAAKAVEQLGLEPDSLDVIVSGNIIKNVKSVVVPNTEGMIGIEAAAAIGALAGDSSKGLLVISDVNPAYLPSVKAFLPKVKVALSHENIKLHIMVIAHAGQHSASVELRDYHTNITEIVKDNTVIFKAESKQEAAEDFAESLSLELIYQAMQEVKIEQIKPLLDKVIKCNTAIANEGLTNLYGVGIGKEIKQLMDDGFYGNDLRNKSACLAGAGSDARMAGCALPVMTTAGSGNVGLTASLPIITFCKERGLEDEMLYRALFFSHLTTVYIKSKIGRLSAYCGPMCASAGVAGAICFLQGKGLDTIEKAITNTLSGVSGIVCDGANSSCAVKIANGVYAAYDGAMLAMSHRCITKGDGIVSNSAEKTIDNISEMAKSGMQRTDEVILDIMTKYHD